MYQVFSIAPDKFSIGPSNPGGVPVLTSVRGLGELEADIIQEAGGEKKRKSNLERVRYTDVEVLRGGQSLGNLHDIRQAYHLWQDQVEVYAVNSQSSISSPGHADNELQGEAASFFEMAC